MKLSKSAASSGEDFLVFLFTKGSRDTLLSMIVRAVKNLLAMAAFISEATVLFHHVSFTLEAFFKFKVCANPTLVKTDV